MGALGRRGGMAVLRTLRVGGAFPRPRGAAPRCPPGPGRGPGFLWKKAGGKNTREEEVLPPWTHLFWFRGTLRGSSFFFAWPAAHLSHARNGPPTSWAGWERQEFWDPLRWAPKIGGCTPNRASEAGTLGVSRVFCPAHGPGHPLLAFGQFTLCPCKKQIGFCSGPCEGRKSATLGSSLPKAFPLGGRWAGEAGSDEGAIWYPTFPCRKEGTSACRLNGIFLLPRWASRSPPHQSPPVTASP